MSHARRDEKYVQDFSLRGLTGRNDLGGVGIDGKI
jgi:hypothetical protein